VKDINGLNLNSKPTSSKSKMPLVLTSLGIIAVLGLGAHQYLTSENYKFGKSFATAEKAAAEGRYAEAMGLYKTLYDSSEKFRSQAEAGIGDIMTPNTLKSVSNSELVGVLKSYNTFGEPPRPQARMAIYDLALQRVKTDPGDDEVILHSLLHETEALNEEGENLSDIDAALIQSINATDPENLEAAVELSEVFFEAGDLERVKQILAPVQSKLDDSEGARVLAQTYISEGQFEQAYPLLSRYTTSRLEAFQSAEAHFTKVSDELWETEFFKLQSGLGPDAFYDKYSEAPESEQQFLVDTHISEIVFNKPKYLNALKLYQRTADIVPVAMDFGVLQLRRAEGLASSAERQAELTAAEQTFLSIRNVAGDTDDYKIYLGQVYFWLGKQDEGQALFNEVLSANDRSPSSLISVSSTLRALGKVGLAADLTKEAYESSEDQTVKYEAAQMLSLLSNTQEERIKWLEKSDPNSASVQANLKELKGQLAAVKGDTKSAIRLYRDAIALYETQPENAATFNNTALVHFSLFDVTGDNADFQNGVDLMSKAVELQSDNSILLRNAADIVLVNALYETLPDRLQFKKLKTRPSMSTLSWYYENEQEKDVLREAFRGNDDFQKAIEYLERSALLAPNSLDVYSSLSEIYYFMDDTDSMVKLVSQMENNKIDITAQQASYFDFLEGSNLEEDLKTLKEREIYQRSLLSDRDLNKATRGALYSRIADNLQAQITYGDETRVTESVKEARSAYTHLKSTQTQGSLYTALLSKVSFEASKNFPSYQAFRQELGKGYADSNVIVFAARKNPELLTWLKSNESFQEAIALEREDLKRFPKTAGPENWAIFALIEDPVSEIFAKNYTSSDIRQALTQMNDIIAPYAGNSIAEGIFVNNMSGQATMSQSRKDRLDALGVSVPEGLLQ